jgi:hypothetical protein
MCPGLRYQTLCVTLLADDHLDQEFYCEMVISRLVIGPEYQTHVDNAKASVWATVKVAI